MTKKIPIKTVKEYPSETWGQPSHWLLLGPFWAVMAILCLGTVFSGRMTWGFDYWSLLSVPFSLIAFALAVIVTLPAVAKPLSSAIYSGLEPFTSKGSLTKKVILSTLGLLTAGLLFYFLRSQAHVYGDGFSILSKMSNPDKVVLYDQLYVQLLTVYFYHHLFAFLKGIVDIPAADIGAIISTIGGMVGVWGLYRLAVLLASDLASRVFLFVGALSSAAVILFFGYIENYTWATAFGLLSLSYAIGYVKEKNGVVPLFLSAVATCAFHAIALPFLVTAVAAVLMKRGGEKSWLQRLSAVKIAVIFTVASLVAAVVIHILLPVSILVPLLQQADNNYTVLSFDHLIDVVNQALLVSPVGITILLFVLIFPGLRRVRPDNAERLLIVISISAFLVSFWVDPKLGAPRDWDLLSFYGFPLTIWGLYRLARHLADRGIAAFLLVPAIVVTLVTIGPNLYEKRNLELAIVRLDGLIWEDPHYSVNYERSYRGISWGCILSTSTKHFEREVKYLQRWLNVNPQSYDAWDFLARNYMDQGKYDSALVCSERAIALGLKKTALYSMAAEAAIKLGQAKKGYHYGLEALTLEPNNASTLTLIGMALATNKQFAEALPYFQRAYQITPTEFIRINNLGIAHKRMQSVDSAFYYFTRALPLASEANQPPIYAALVDLAVKMGDTKEANRLLQRFRQLYPRDPNIPVLTEAVSAMSKQ